MSSNKPSNIDEYISGFSVDVQTGLKEIRSIIKDTIPEAEESISYGMPTYTFEGKTLIQSHEGKRIMPYKLRDSLKFGRIIWGAHQIIE